MAPASNAVRPCLMALLRAPRAPILLSQLSSLVQTRVAASKRFSTSRMRLTDKAPSAGKTPSADKAPSTDKTPSGEKNSGNADLKTTVPHQELVIFSKMYQDFLKNAPPESLNAMDTLSQEMDTLAQENGFKSMDHEMEEALGDENLRREDKDLDAELSDVSRVDMPNKWSWWYDEDDEECITEEHDEIDEDDITSMAHAKLDEIREMRHYARLIVWEMPLLHRFAKPFVPPGKDEVLRWRYTSYMGESHPAEKKVVVEFCVNNLEELTEVQANKLRKLAGPRYNPDTDVVKMSCESFEHQAQNKRYLSDLVNALVDAAKDPTDMFEDVPLDLRHHKPRRKPRFPVEWRMTDERRQQIEEYRAAMQQEDAKKAEEGLMVDGEQKIKDFLYPDLATMRQNIAADKAKAEEESVKKPGVEG